VLVDPALRARCLNILNTLDEKGLATQFDTVIRGDGVEFAEIAEQCKKVNYQTWH